jgi:hypothetical protein
MNIARSIGEHRHDQHGTGDSGITDAGLALGGDERRMHVRAYNHWVSLLKGRAYPSIEDLDPAGIADFGPNSVLLDFTQGVDDPSIPYIGRALREECGIGHSVTHVAEVPARSLLSRLTDHYLQIIANRAPIGFEAEFVGTRGSTTLYRGILMPFSSNDESIDFIYGVINWKEVADPQMQVRLAAELEAAVRSAPHATAPSAPVWADGPSLEEQAPEGLADHLAVARDCAAAAANADLRSRAALYEALGRAHDFAIAASADAQGLAELLEDAGIAAQARAPLTPIVKLVFGSHYDKTRLAEFAAVLGHAARSGIRAGGLADHLRGAEGGIKGIVAAERARRADGRKRPLRPVAAVAQRETIAEVALPGSHAAGSVVVLVARGTADGRLEIVGATEDSRVVLAAARALTQ